MWNPERIERALARVNALRRPGLPASPGLAEAEALLDTLFDASTCLAVYGTLAPGRANHHLLAGVPGAWTTGHVHGDLRPAGWGATLGYPALRWRPGGPLVPVHVLASPHLPAHWDRLDRFEGDGYLRILVPVYAPAGLVAVANLYEGREDA